MRSQTWMVTAVMLAALAWPALAAAESYFGFTIGVGNAPPPPRLVFVHEPDVMVVPGSSVYVVEDTDCDMFRYGPYWYVSNAGYWYRAPRYSGPFVAVDVRRVPRAILNVPPRHWKHHPLGGPPGQMKKHGRWRD